MVGPSSNSWPNFLHQTTGFSQTNSRKIDKTTKAGFFWQNTNYFKFDSNFNKPAPKTWVTECTQDMVDDPEQRLSYKSTYDEIAPYKGRIS